MALDLHAKNGFRAISFEFIGVLDSYFIHRYIIIKYRSSSIKTRTRLELLGNSMPQSVAALLPLKFIHI